jgi:hypothetical protein
MTQNSVEEWFFLLKELKIFLVTDPKTRRPLLSLDFNTKNTPAETDNKAALLQA